MTQLPVLWIFLGAMILLFFFMGRSGQPENGHEDYMTPSGLPPPLVTPDPTAAPGQKKKFIHPIEIMPEANQEHAYSAEELRYCFAEKFRLKGARSVVEDPATNDSDGAKMKMFNLSVKDYNLRCGNILYHERDLPGAKSSIDAYQAQYLAEGRNRFLPPPAPTLAIPRQSVMSERPHRWAIPVHKSRYAAAPVGVNP